MIEVGDWLVEVTSMGPGVVSSGQCTEPLRVTPSLVRDPAWRVTRSLARDLTVAGGRV